MEHRKFRFKLEEIQEKQLSHSNLIEENSQSIKELRNSLMRVDDMLADLRSQIQRTNTVKVEQT